MTEQTHTAAAAGPILAAVQADMGEVLVTIDPAATVARVVISTKDAEGPSADAVRRTRITQDGNRLSITVPEVEGSNVGVSVYGSGNFIQNVTSVGRGQTMTGVTIVNGRVISGGISGGSAVVSPIEVRVTLPAGSGVRMNGRNANLTVSGVLAALDYSGHNGHIRTGVVGRIKVRTHNGHTDADVVQEWADIEGHNGDTEIGTYSGTAARLITHNGSIRLAASPAASGQIEARSYNGNIRLHGTNRTGLDVQTSTRNGRVSK
ncbi:hypothetical protein QMK19_33910 [Streptomyces sp. H10-C2]|uniref:hypothetical protein n=1 Tax=unclassified Streptomyces TaxID=2593676 RepID=UPI0024BA82AE|nr:MULTISPECIES: hypothetical protein [unclassified Streptomyces]MDJ0345544.1 hypothetical protein [Streptomyces sp. PH10-H1]MDJ0374490.1 hypothetical protein [Streptomyces sp. H10-C2]